jgi:hypothetical protein
MDLDRTRLKLSPHECERRQREGLCRRCEEAGYFAKDCRAPPLKRKILFFQQQGYVLGEVQDEPKNNEGANTQKDALTPPSL